MSNRVLEFIIRARDATAQGIQSVRERFHGFQQRISGGLKSLAGSMAGLLGVSLGAAGVIRGFTSAIQKAFEFERYQTQFKVLLGSLDAAKQRMADLQEFSASTPFQFADIAVASRQLHVFTGGVLGTKDSLRLIGDAAAATGSTIQELSMWVGRAYSAIKGGAPFGEAAMRLMELGVLTPEVRREMEDLQKSGASNIEIWNKLEAALAKYNGGMKELSQTGEGLFSTLKDNWNLTLAEFGNAFMDLSKDKIGALTDKLKELRENGDIAVWADRVLTSLNAVSKVVSTVTSALSAAYKWSGVQDTVAMTKGVWAAAGAASTGDFKGMGKAFAREAAGGNYTNMAMQYGARHGNEFAQRVLGENQADVSAAAEHEAKVRGDAIARQTEAGAKKEKSMKEAVLADMAAAQKVTDAKVAAEKAEKEKADREKADAELADAQEKRMRALIDEEKQARLNMVSEQLEKLRTGQERLTAEQSAAQDRLSRARAAAERAWGWYRDPASMKAQMEEEKANAAAEKQFAKDAQRLQRRANWQTRQDLSPEQESVRRVIVARAEEKAAEQALVKIEGNTREIAEKITALMRMK